MIGRSGRVDREGGNLGLAQRSGVDEVRDGLHAARTEERHGGLGERGRAARAIALAQRGLDRLDAEPVAASLVAEQMAPPAGAPGLTAGADAEHVGARARDRANAGTRAGGCCPCRDDVVDDDPLLGIGARMHLVADGSGVGACDREHRSGQLAARGPRAPERLVGHRKQRVDRSSRADCVLVAWPSVRHVQLACSKLQHRRQRLRRATINAQQEASVRPVLRVR